MNLFQLKNDYQLGLISKHAYIEAMHELHTSLFDYSELIRLTDIASIEITDGTVTMTSRQSGIKLLCDLQDKRIVPIEILNFGGYESVETVTMLQFVRPGMTVLDIGANIGWYSMNLAKLVPDVNIHAFEPLPSTYSFLERNVALNRLDGINLYNFAFSNRNGTEIFYFYPEGSGNASITNLSKHPNTQEIPCLVRTLDDFIEESSLEVDFIKCDVEGAELFVFEGGLATLRSQRPIIFTEMLRKWSTAFGYHPNDIIELLSKIGYQCFIIREGVLVPFTQMDADTVETNFFFLHSVQHRANIETIAERH